MLLENLKQMPNTADGDEKLVETHSHHHHHHQHHRQRPILLPPHRPAPLCVRWMSPSADAFMDDLARRIARSDHRGLTRSAAHEHVRGRIGNALAAGVTKQIMSFLEATFKDDGDTGAENEEFESVRIDRLEYYMHSDCQRGTQPTSQ